MPHPPAPLSVCAALVLAAGCAAPAPATAADRCNGQPLCRDLGHFTASVTKVNVTRTNAVTAYQGVRTMVRFTNVSPRPIVLAYRDRSSAVSDDKGLAYRWSAKSYGIGVVTANTADPQFRLEPGESREASFDGVLQYSMRQQVAGSVFSHDLTIVELALVEGQRIRELRDHAISFSGLTASAGYAAAAGAGATAATAGTLVRADAAPPAAAPPQEPALPAAAEAAAPALAGVPPPSPAPQAAPAAPAAPPRPAAATAAECPPDRCQAQGPLVAQVLRVNVTKAGNVTAYQTVQSVVRFTNVSSRPLVLAYKQGSGTTSDETGAAYRYAFKTQGIGLVGNGSADPQFRLAPGESRDASFAATLQYNVRHSVPGRVFSQDITIAELEVLGPSQMRSAHEYALSFSNLSAGGSGAPLPAGAGADPAQAINGIVNLLKGFKK